MMLIQHESDRRTRSGSRRAGLRARLHDGVHDAGSVPRQRLCRPDPRQGTGDFAKIFKEKQNEIVVQVARAEPTTGTVLEAGVQRWNDNGSADVLVATKITTKSPDGKQPSRAETVGWQRLSQEGQQWKISKLIQVI